MNCANKSVIVAGGLGGIGIATCKALLAKGVKNLGIFDLVENSNIVSELKRSSSANVKFWKVNATCRNEIDNGFKAALDEFKTIDVLVNCVGIINEMQFEKCIEVNLLGTIHLNYAAIDHMGKSKGASGGTVVNIASMAGLRSFPPLLVYSASKHGVIGLTKGLGSDFYLERTGIKFFTICPGVTVTPMIKSNIESPIHELKDFPDLPHQPAEICGMLLVEALEKNINGSIWKIADGKLEQYQPEIQTSSWNDKK